jgi:Heavy metal binding domain
MKRWNPVLACALALAPACADGARLPPRSLADPSNPRAPEAGLPRAPDDAAAPPEAPRGLAYVCPMHADVVRDGPGTCPRCGMPLIAHPPARSGNEAGAR